MGPTGVLQNVVNDRVECAIISSTKSGLPSALSTIRAREARSSDTVARSSAIAWVLTIPAAGAIGAATYWLLHFGMP